jgi:hypothetical protein
LRVFAVQASRLHIPHQCNRAADLATAKPFGRSRNGRTTMATGAPLLNRKEREERKEK